MSRDYYVTEAMQDGAQRFVVMVWDKDTSSWREGPAFAERRLALHHVKECRELRVKLAREEARYVG